MMVRLMLAGAVVICCGDAVVAQKSGGRGQSARHAGQSRPGLGPDGRHLHGGTKDRPYYGRYPESVEVYNFGYPGGPHYGFKYRSRASYHVVREPVAPNSRRTVIQVNRYAAEYQFHAERLLRERQYDDALRAAQHAIVEDPENGYLYLFQSQVLIAIGEYTAAANLVRFATESLDPKDWGHVIENRASFYKGSAYKLQMGKLEQSIRDAPGDGYAHFLLGYQYLYQGRTKEAADHLAKAIDLDVHRELAAQFVALASRDSGSARLESLPVPPQPATAR